MVRETMETMETHNAAFGNKVSRLKTLFQDADKENRGRSMTTHYSYTSVSKPIKSHSAERSPDSKRKRPDSVDTNQNATGRRSASAGMTTYGVAASVTSPLEVQTGGTAMDGVVTDDLYETTNHVQRFHRTRAIFAQMEQQLLNSSGAVTVQSPGSGVQMRSRRTTSRSVSPRHSHSALSPPASPGRVPSSQPRRESPKSSPRWQTSVDGANSVFDYSRTSHGGYINSSRYNPTHSRDTRVGSVENILQNQTHNNSFKSNELRDTKVDQKSKSESDLLDDEPDIFTTQPSPRSLIQKFEQNQSSRPPLPQEPSQLSHTYRFLNSNATASDTPKADCAPAVQEKHTLPATVTSYTSASSFKSSYTKPAASASEDEALPIANEKPVSATPVIATSKSSSITVDTSASHVKPVEQSKAGDIARSSSGCAGSSTVTSVRSAIYGRQPLRSNSASSVGPSSNVVEAKIKAREYIPKFQPDEEDDMEARQRMESIFSWRSRRNREKTGSGTDSDTMSQSLDSGTSKGAFSSSVTSSISGGGVLLPRRRQQSEETLSKEQIEASLREADAYWRNSSESSDLPSHIGGHGRMSDSIHSSGSGEEMARSDSNHDIVLDSPASPTLKQDFTVGFTLDTEARSEPESWTSKYTLDSNNRHSAASDSVSSDHDGLLHRTDTFEKSLVEHSELLSNNTSHRDRLDTSSTSSSVITQQQSSLARSPSPDTHARLSRDVTDLVPDKPEVPAEEDAGGGEISLDPDEDVDYESPPSPGVIIKPPPPFPNKSPAFLNSEGGSDDLLADSHEDYMIQREDGDGTDEPFSPYANGDDTEGAEVVNQIWEQYFDYSLHHKQRLDQAIGKFTDLGDGKYIYEVEGLPSSDPDDELYQNAKPPSRVSFSNSPIIVCTTYAVEDYDRKNEDVDPMAASAEYELEKRVERMDQFEVDLAKGSDGLGLSIIGMGVGADAGLEKLGIFIKTLTEGGAAQRDGRIQVNDQIIEVDGKSLVGVTQAYAASVLRNTSGKVKFLIGREKDPSKSEVARLIQQSLELDRRRAEAKQRVEQQEQQRFEGDEEEGVEAEAVGEHEEEARHDEEEGEEPELAQQHYTEQQAQPPPLPASPPPGGELPLSEPEDEEGEEDEDGVVGDDGRLVLEEYEQVGTGSSSEVMSPADELDAQQLYIKLKEAQYKNAVAEAELAKVKAKLAEVENDVLQQQKPADDTAMILLEKTEAQKRHYERKCEEMAQRLRDSEKTLTQLQHDMAKYQQEKNSKNKDGSPKDPADILEDSQGEYIKLEQSMKSDFGNLEKKYAKAKKRIKEYQTREKEIMQEREAFVLQQTEMDHQYNDIVSRLKEKIFRLENRLEETVKAAGLPTTAATPGRTPNRESDINLPPPAPLPPLKPLEMDDISQLSDIDPDEQLDITAIENRDDISIDSIPGTPLLDNSANRSKAHLVTSGAMGSRRPPTRTKGKVHSHENEDNNDDPFARDDLSDTSSIASQQSGSYDPSKAEMALGQQSELIPMSVDESDIGGVQLLSAASKTGSGVRLLSASTSTKSSTPSLTSQSSAGAGSGITLLGMRTLDTEYGPSSVERNNRVAPNSSTLSLDTGMRRTHSREDSTGTNSSGHSGDLAESAHRSQSYDFVSARLTTDTPMEGGASVQAGKKAKSMSALNQYQSTPVPEWSASQVCHWLSALSLEQHSEQFMSKQVDGQQLLNIDNNKIKQLGITNTKERDLLKKKVKELKAAIERERKLREKEQKQREKLEKQASKLKKKK